MPDKRDYLSEAQHIAAGTTLKLAQREHILALIEWDAKLAERVRVLEEKVLGLCGEIEAAETQAAWEAAGGHGQHVSFNGDFAGAIRMPSVLKRLGWWRREMLAALAATDEKGEA